MAKHLRKSNKLKKIKPQRIGFINYNNTTIPSEFMVKIHQLMMRDLMKAENELFFASIK